MKVIYLFRTLYDIGISIILLRFRFEFRKLIDKKLPYKLRLRLAGYKFKYPKWKNVLNNLNAENYKLGSIFFTSEEIEFSFNFLNKIKKLTIPISWDQSDISRLWNFNLHYFDWARKLIDESIKNNCWLDEIRLLDRIIDDWIDQNPPGFGDGWHSYTLSLRIRNWIYLFRIFPELGTEKKLASLWMQICWLNSHQENCYGGNHLIENLITLIIASLQFEGKEAPKIYLKIITKLKNELSSQILTDGGHFERSASYHFLILDRLTELAFVIEATLNERPEWLLSKIKYMNNWAKLVILKSDNLPQFNDSPKFLAGSPSKIISFSSSLLNNTKYDHKDFRSKIISLVPILNNKKTNKIEISSITNLNNTGWTLFRPNNNLEIVFKFGKPCPKELPAHVHSDLLSFDIFRNGRPFLVSCGTSIYENSKERIFERSSPSHNIFQLGVFKTKNLRTIDWIEPIETWNSFRAARKANPVYKFSGKDDNGNLWIRASHDGFSRHGAQYERMIILEKNKKNNMNFILIDNVQSKRKLAWRQFWHLAPEESQSELNPVISQMKQYNNISIKWIDSWYSIGFGNRILRKSLCISGIILPGKNIFKTELNLFNT